MKSRYTKRQIKEAISYWKNKLNESDNIDVEETEDIDEDVSKLGKTKRAADDARKAAIGAALEAGDPMYQLVQRHEQAKAAAVKSCKNEIKGADNKDLSKIDKIAIFNSCIKDGHWIDSKGDNSTMIICASIHMPSKKGILGRLFTGSLGKLFTNVGVAALQEYVKTFLGKSFSKQVSAKTVFDGVDEQKDRVKYYVAFNLMNKDTKLDEYDEIEVED